MRIFVLLILFFYTISVGAQSVDALDDKNGFKTYQLGESIATLRNRGLELKVIDEKDKFYTVTNNRETELFHFQVADLKLSFSPDNKLSSIWITLNPGLELGEVGASLAKLFGNHTSKGVNRKDVPFESWKGSRVGLIVYYYPPFSGNSAGWQPMVFVYDLKVDQENLESGF